MSANTEKAAALGFAIAVLLILTLACVGLILGAYYVGGK